MLRTEEQYGEILETFSLAILLRGCLKCSSTISFYTRTMARCKNKYCKYRYSIYKNTVFQSCKVDVIAYLKVIDLYLHFLPLELIHRITMISKDRIGKMINNFNHIDIYLNYLNNLKFGGTGNIIEIDESKFGKRKYNKGHRVEGVWVFGAVERRSRRIFLIPIRKRTRNFLENIMFRFIHPYSIIYSDCWKSYARLNFFYLAHKTVNHSKEFVNKEENVHTNTIEGNWSGIKRNIPFRNRTNNLVRVFLLRYMLYRNNNDTMLKDLLILSLIHKFD